MEIKYKYVFKQVHWMYSVHRCFKIIRNDFTQGEEFGCIRLLIAL